MAPGVYHRRKISDGKRMKYFTVLLFLVGVADLSASTIDTSSAYHLSFTRDVIASAGIGAVLMGGYIVESRIKPFNSTGVSPLNRDNINSFDRSATFHWSPEAENASTYTLFACMGAPAILMLSEKARKDYLTIGVMYFQTLGLTNGLTSLAKGVAERTRPFVYNPSAPMSEKLTADARTSFFSGHASNAFASSMFFASAFREYHPGSKWNWPVLGLSLSVAAWTGFLRYTAGKHFPSDILTGAAIGSMIGFIVPYLHRSSSHVNKVFFNLSDDGILKVGYRF
jgi:membrane-associated phospholipid phosphatase